jgi:hypothetical protein
VRFVADGVEALDEQRNLRGFAAAFRAFEGDEQAFHGRNHEIHETHENNPCRVKFSLRTALGLTTKHTKHTKAKGRNSARLPLGLQPQGDAVDPGNFFRWRVISWFLCISW